MPYSQKKIYSGPATFVQCNLDYPDPFVHRADRDIPDKLNGPDKWSAYFSCMVYDT